MASAGALEGELHVVMFPWFAFGHISPFLQLARKLVAFPAVRVTFLSTPANVPRIASLLPSLPSVSVHPLVLPPVPGLPPGLESTADIPRDAAPLLMRANDLLQPQLSSLLADFRPHLLLHDFAQPWLSSIATPLGVKTVYFSVYSAVSIAYVTFPTRRLPTLDDFRAPPEGFPSDSSIKSVPRYQAADFLNVYTSFDGDPSPYDRLAGSVEGSAAIVFKSCVEMEGPYLDYVRAQYGKPVLLAGPVVPEPPSGELDREWAPWLDGFADGTVVFCSFGSETFLTADGATELLLGLEMTGLPFVAVLNFPGEGGGEEALRRSVPEGLEERAAGRARVRTGWVQQQHILEHRSVGCYVCHAGLSSVLEGLVAGRRLVLLPQKVDQFLNTALFVGDLGVGVEVERNPEDGRFKREAVCTAVWKAVAAEETARERYGKLREFLLDKEAQGKFMVELVRKLRELAAQ